MSVYIVDATVAAEFLLNEQYSQNAKAFFQGAMREDHFLAPEVCWNECVNMLWKRVRFHAMPESAALTAIADLRLLPLTRINSIDVLESALAIGLKNQSAIYDSLYIALALRTTHPLVTPDMKQARVAADEGLQIIPITDFTL
jgi:predicted nucleic acid-binding protein